MIMLAMSTMAISQTKKGVQSPNYNNPLASVIWCGFNTDDLANHLCIAHLECDSQSYWIRFEIVYPYNIKEMRDSDGRPTYGKYSISKGKHLYLKLANEEIIKLTCTYQTQKYVDNYISNTGIYKEYDIDSYFLLTSSQIDLLSKDPSLSSISKIRMELLYDVIDGTNIDCQDFKTTYNKITGIKEEKLAEKETQRQKNANPLKDF